MLFNGWDMVVRTLVMGVLSYIALILLLRVSGKRTLSKMNAFDFVVTIALGSTLATVLLSKEVALAQGVAAFAVLIGLQFVVTWLAVRVHAVAQLVKSEPTLLYYREQMLHNALHRERIMEAEVLAAVRNSGQANLASVEAVVLETDGTLSVTMKSDASQGKNTLINVKTTELSAEQIK